MATCRASSPSDIDFGCGLQASLSSGTRSSTRRVLAASSFSSAISASVTPMSILLRSVVVVVPIDPVLDLLPPGKELSSLRRPGDVSRSGRSRPSSEGASSTHPFRSSTPALRVRVVRSSPRRSATSLIVAGPVWARAARMENCVARSPWGRSFSSESRVSSRARFRAARQWHRRVRERSISVSTRRKCTRIRCGKRVGGPRASAPRARRSAVLPGARGPRPEPRIWRSPGPGSVASPDRYR